MNKKKNKKYISHKRRRKRLRGRIRNVIYSTEGTSFWEWVSEGLHHVMLSPLDIVKMCVIVLGVVAIAVICFLISPIFWMCVFSFAIVILIIHTLWGMIKDMKRELDRMHALLRRGRKRAQAMAKKESDRFCDIIEALKVELYRMEAMNQVVLWQLQQATAEPEKQNVIIIPLINDNSMNFFGNVDMNGGNIYGDNATHNETHHHFGSEQETKVSMEGLTPYVTLLQSMIAPMRESKDWRAILCPYRAAVTEGVLPKWPHKTFVSLMDIKVPASSYSEWMNTDKYLMEELEPYSVGFQRLKAAIANPE